MITALRKGDATQAVCADGCAYCNGNKGAKKQDGAFLGLCPTSYWLRSHLEMV
jgi:hypothetical protein